DNIYALDTRSGERFQVTSRPYGAFNPAPDPKGETLYFNDYTFYGHDLASMPLDPNDWKPLSQVTVAKDDTYKVWVDQEKEHLDVLDEVGDELYAGYEWQGFPGLFNPYSWGAVIEDINGNAEVGISLQDELSTMRASATAGYNANEQVWRYGVDFSYQKYFPIFDLSVEAGPRSISLDPSDPSSREDFTQREIGASVRLPLVLTRSAYAQQLTVSTGINSISVSDYDAQSRFLSQVGNFEQLASFQHRVFYALQRRLSQRDLTSRLGFSILAQLNHTPQDPGTQTDPNLIGWLGGATVQGFLPGIGKHHSLEIRGSYQQQYAPVDTAGRFLFNTYVFNTPFFGNLRGYPYQFPPEQMYIASVRYHMPLLYPDLAIWNLAYIQRISLTGFFDYGYLTNRIGDIGVLIRERRSAGLDINLDVNGMRYLPQFNVGMRVGYAFDAEEDPFFVSALVAGVPLQTFNFLK
ncbi:MAG: hypothetical protein AAFQ98_01730, partial [Bacteroidota bacterium]